MVCDIQILFALICINTNMLCLARRWLFGGFRLTTVTVLIAATKTFTKNGREAYTQLNGIKEIKWRKRACMKLTFSILRKS